MIVKIFTKVKLPVGNCDHFFKKKDSGQTFNGYIQA